MPSPSTSRDEPSCLPSISPVPARHIPLRSDPGPCVASCISRTPPSPADRPDRPTPSAAGRPSPHNPPTGLRSPHEDRFSFAEHLDLLLGQGLTGNRQFRTRLFWWLLLLLRLQLLQDSCDLRTLFVRVVADPLDHRLSEAILFDPLRQAAVAELPIHLRGLERMPLQGEGHALDLLRWIATPINKGCDDLSFY